MRSGPRLALAAVALMAAILAACGEENELEVEEGVPVELGGLRYNVVLTRFLNPNDAEDRGYLRDEPKPPVGREYLAVFMTVENEGDESARVSERLEVVDTRDNTYEPRESESPYALRLAAAIPPGEELPAPDTPAASGPIEGAMVLYLVDDVVTENRPLELEIPSDSGATARIELDI
jgi:hypothetical protein